MSRVIFMFFPIPQNTFPCPMLIPHSPRHKGHTPYPTPYPYPYCLVHTLPMHRALAICMIDYRGVYYRGLIFDSVCAYTTLKPCTPDWTKCPVPGPIVDKMSNNRVFPMCNGAGERGEGQDMGIWRVTHNTPYVNLTGIAGQ